MNAQGEDVVAGVRTPEKVETSLKEHNPAVYNQLLDTAMRLEKHFHDMQDMEFTVQEGKLYMLQTRNGKRTAAAALRIACDLVDEGMIDEKQAVLMIEPKSLDQLLHPQFDQKDLKQAKEIACGLNASPGAGAGKVVFSAEEVEDWVKNKGEKRVILVRLETSPEEPHLNVENYSKESPEERMADTFANNILIPIAVWRRSPEARMSARDIQRKFTAWSEVEGINKWIALGRVGYETGIYAFSDPQKTRRIM